MHSIDDFSPDKVGTESPNGLHAILRELQGLKVGIAVGSDPATPLALAGFGAVDHVIGATYYDTTAFAFTDVGPAVPGGMQAHAAGQVVTNISTSDGVCIVFWFSKNGS